MTPYVTGPIANLEGNAMSESTATRCAQCGVTDSAPKVVVIDHDDRYHHDCLRADLRAQLNPTPSTSKES